MAGTLIGIELTPVQIRRIFRTDVPRVQVALRDGFPSASVSNCQNSAAYADVLGAGLMVADHGHHRTGGPASDLSLGQRRTHSTRRRLARLQRQPSEGKARRVAEQSASRVTEDMVTRASKVLWTEVNPEYQVDPRDFTDADIAAGKLREADDADTAQNRAIVRRVLEAAFPDAWLPDDVRELLTDLAQGGYADADATMLASQLLAKYSQQAGLG